MTFVNTRADVADDIVDRLRTFAFPICHEAREEIARLRAERDLLRSLLKRALDEILNPGANIQNGAYIIDEIDDALRQRD